MNIPAIKDLIKNNVVQLNRYKSGNLFYTLYFFNKNAFDHHSAHQTYEFPVPINDVGEAEMKDEDKAIYFMRYIRKAIDNKTFVQI